MPHAATCFVQETLHMAVARSILAGPAAARQARLRSIAPLHPSALGDVPAELLAELRVEHAHDIAALRQWLDKQDAQERESPGQPEQADGPSSHMSDDDLLRVLLAVRFNAHYRCAW